MECEPGFIGTYTLGLSVVIVSLYMLYVYFSRKLILHDRKISDHVILRVICKRILAARRGLALLGPTFYIDRFNQLYS